MYNNEVYSDATYRTVPVENGSGKETKKKGGGFRKFMLSISLGLCFGLFAGIGFYAVQLGTGQTLQNSGTVQETTGQDNTKQENTKQENAEVPASSDGVVNPSSDQVYVPTNVSNVVYRTSSDVSEVVKRVMPAMVSIINNYTQTGTTFWGQTYSESSAASGSGIIVSQNETELLIVTNNHVVEDADSLTVTFINETEAHAVIKGLDADMDLAVIAVPLEELDQETKSAITIATLGDSDSMELGEYVIAIGNALGYGQSVTDGIISALNRELTLSDGSTGIFIQTNAAINPGNSGGALLNINGEVIGINSNKIGGTAIEGMGYAIPITSASPIIADLMERQTRSVKVAEEQMGYMGITLQNFTSEFSQLYGVPQGVFVYSVEPGLAADKAGIIKGDIIVNFDGQKISSSADLQNVLQYYAAGETVEIEVKRIQNGEYVSRKLEITLGSRS